MRRSERTYVVRRCSAARPTETPIGSCDARRRRDPRRADDERIVAAHLQREHDLRTTAELLVQQRAGIRAAGEEQAVDLPMIRQRNAGVLLALHEVQHARRQAGFAPHFDGRARHTRRQFGRLEHDRITRDQRRHDMPVRQMPGKVIRPEHRHHAMRTMPQYRGAVGHRRTLLAGALVVRLNRDLDLGRHRRDFGARFPQRLAGLAADRFGQRFLALGQQRGEAAHDRAAFFERLNATTKRTRARAAHGAVDVSSRCARGLPIPSRPCPGCAMRIRVLCRRSIRRR
jgi:hypothetical protein